MALREILFADLGVDETEAVGNEGKLNKVESLPPVIIYFFKSLSKIDIFP